jgi:hypothetical protein
MRTDGCLPEMDLKTAFKVYYDDQINPRDQGGDGLTVSHVSWTKFYELVTESG